MEAVLSPSAGTSTVSGGASSGKVVDKGTRCYSSGLAYLAGVTRGGGVGMKSVIMASKANKICPGGLVVNGIGRLGFGSCSAAHCTIIRPCRSVHAIASTTVVASFSNGNRIGG